MYTIEFMPWYHLEMHIHSWLNKYKLFLLAGFFGFLILGFVFVFFFTSRTNVINFFRGAENSFLVDEKYQEYFKTNPTFPELFDYLSVVADERGSVYALNTLIYGELPPNIDTHLLGHFVARKLYKEKSVDGLEYCTSDLGYACAHAIVIEALFEKGLSVFDEVNAICERVKGPGAYHMCFHGFGHGVLAFVDYEFPKAIELCGKVGTEEYAYNESAECVGGAIMEMRGGVHDPELWEQNGKKYLDEKNPINLCLSDFMSEEYRYICFVYITPFIFDSLGAQDLPTYEEYGPAIRSCNVLTNSEYREACYGGFAKEFVGFLFGRDIRKIDGITDAQLADVFTACKLAEVEDGVAACVKHAVIDLLGSGVFGFEIAGRFCQIVDIQYFDYCVSNYITIVGEQNVLNLEERIKFCEYTEATFNRNCELQV